LPENSPSGLAKGKFIFDICPERGPNTLILHFRPSWFFHPNRVK